MSWHLSTTALIIASLKGHIDVLKLLLDKGANVNAKTINGNTALMLASKKGHGDIVKALLSSGADVNAKNNKGRTTLIVEKGAEEEEDVPFIVKIWPFGPDGLICQHIYPSAYTYTEKKFWNNIGGCE